MQSVRRVVIQNDNSEHERGISPGWDIARRARGSAIQVVRIEVRTALGKIIVE